MMTAPNMVFSTAPGHGLVARSGWEQEEARTVLRDLGWTWVENVHALVPPDDIPAVEAGVQAWEELHLHGYRTGYAMGPYGAMTLTRHRAEEVFTRGVSPPTQPSPSSERRPMRSAPDTTTELAADEASPIDGEAPAI